MMHVCLWNHWQKIKPTLHENQSISSHYHNKKANENIDKKTILPISFLKVSCISFAVSYQCVKWAYDSFDAPH